jgi:beta-mannanase
MKAEEAYPGDDYVDIIGIDVYDQTKWTNFKDPVERWDKLTLNGPYGLAWHRDFAKAHNKPMSYPEWGVGGNDSGDNPYFIQRMHDWFVANNIVYESYWQSNSAYPGKLSADQYPLSAAKYKELFGQ